jgi:simple sugar transport system permease protein
MPLIIFVTVVIIMSKILNHTAYGFKVYMLGSNSSVARFSGINNPRITLKTHVITGLL